MKNLPSEISVLKLPSYKSNLKWVIGDSTNFRKVFKLLSMSVSNSQTHCQEGIEILCKGLINTSYFFQLLWVMKQSLVFGTLPLEICLPNV